MGKFKLKNRTLLDNRVHVFGRRGHIDLLQHGRDVCTQLTERPHSSITETQTVKSEHSQITLTLAQLFLVIQNCKQLLHLLRAQCVDHGDRAVNGSLLCVYILHIR